MDIETALIKIGKIMRESLETQRETLDTLKRLEAALTKTEKAPLKSVG